MSRLSDFKPIQTLSIPGADALDTSGLILIVGPNSSGKSQLLRDIHHRVTGAPRTPVVASEIALGSLEVESLLKCLEEEGLLRTVTEDGGPTQLFAQTTSLGIGDAIPQVSPNQPRSWYNEFNGPASKDARRKSEFLA
ncbi:MAG: hypothetical protein HEQ38_03295 [Gemmatimonas sp.]|nr:hypothetical protein [Gemmatimonas sp.]